MASHGRNMIQPLLFVETVESTKLIIFLAAYISGGPKVVTEKTAVTGEQGPLSCPFCSSSKCISLWA